MKYKVGDKVKARRKYSFNKGEIVKITKVHERDRMYFCEGTNVHCWQPERDLEPLDQPLTFQQKLDRFKSEPIGFLVKSKEIADELAKVFEKEGMKSRQGEEVQVLMHRTITENKCYSGIPFVSYNYYQGEQRLVFGIAERAGKDLDELLDITLEELKPYNAPQTLEDKLALFKAGTHVLHTPTQEIYDKLMIELEKRWYVWASGDKPTEFNAYSGNESCVGYDNRLGDSCGIRLGLLEWCNEAGMEILSLTTEDFATPQVITITSDGYHRVTAESNGVLAEALCNPTDKFSIHKGSHMALKRLLEKLEEDTIEKLVDLSGSTLEEPEGFHVGDIVEVVRCYYSFADGAKGVQGVVVETGDNWCRVKLPVKFHDEVEWNFTDEQLKLVRKYNA